jgi:hypothetical protein
MKSRNHKKSFNDIKYENETELSKYVFNKKLKGVSLRMT